MNIKEIIDFIQQQLKPIPPARWTVTSADGGNYTVTSHKVGVDASRGPWVKFEYTDGTNPKEIQGYQTWNKGDRIKYGPDGNMRECDDDDLSFTAATNGAGLLMIVKFHFEQDGDVFAIRFQGQSA
jgi:hypothetical protein